MQKEKIIKIILLNLGLVVVDTILFSPGILNIQIGETNFKTAIGVTALFMSIVIFIYGNYNFFAKREKIIQTGEIDTFEDCVKALKESYDKGTFAKDISNIIKQIERFQNKKETVKDILLQKFSSTEMSYSKFEGTISEVENIFLINIKSILNKLNAFDEEEYNQILKNTIRQDVSDELISAKMEIYKEYITFVKNSIEDNEEIILKLDKLLLEISKFNSLEDGEINKMGAMIEIDELIDKAKLYR